MKINLKNTFQNYYFWSSVWRIWSSCALFYEKFYSKKANLQPIKSWYDFLKRMNMDVSWVYKMEMRHWVTKPVWNFWTCLTFRWRSWQWRLGVFIYNCCDVSWMNQFFLMSTFELKLNGFTVKWRHELF
jgi:hypothetical protein